MLNSCYKKQKHIWNTLVRTLMSKMCFLLLNFLGSREECRMKRWYKMHYLKAWWDFHGSLHDERVIWTGLKSTVGWTVLHLVMNVAKRCFRRTGQKEYLGKQTWSKAMFWKVLLYKWMCNVNETYNHHYKTPVESVLRTFSFQYWKSLKANTLILSAIFFFKIA